MRRKNHKVRSLGQRITKSTSRWAGESQSPHASCISCTRGVSCTSCFIGLVGNGLTLDIKEHLASVDCRTNKMRLCRDNNPLEWHRHLLGWQSQESPNYLVNLISFFLSTCCLTSFWAGLSPLSGSRQHFQFNSETSHSLVVS